MEFSRELKLDKEQFLARYWQREPLLIRNAIPGFSTPLPADELAGLAMEADIESRIIEHRDGRWLLQHGPFNAGDFQRESPWTLLVQAVDHYIPEVCSLLQLLDFLPRWRVDDVMVSYAVDGGSVGPHYDNYDVFLLQGEGERLWQVGQFCDSDSALEPHDELRILRHFEPEQEFLLGPGDMLYLPPGIAHWGVARGECTTFSLGLRAPRLNQMVSRWADQLLEQLEPDLFYSDARSEVATRPGEIRPRDIERAQAQLQAALDQCSDSHWFGELVTEPRYDSPPDEHELAKSRAQLQAGTACIVLSPAAKLAWQQEAGGIAVFANGESMVFPDSVLTMLMALCDSGTVEDRGAPSAMAEGALLDYLLETGCIYVD